MLSAEFELPLNGISKRVHLSVIAVELVNPQNGCTERVYTVHDSGAAVTLLHCSVVDRLGLAGKHHIETLGGLHSLRDVKVVKVESVTLGIRGLDGDYMIHTIMVTDVNVTSRVAISVHLCLITSIWEDILNS